MHMERTAAAALVPLGQHKLPPLPYPYNALEPVISRTALRIHHDKHHQSYVDGLNEAEIQLARSRAENNYSLIKHWERELAFNGSGHILHSIFWTVMAPPRNTRVGPETLRHIIAYFGSMSAFQRQFSEAAIQVEASGWAILVWQPAWSRLEILTAEKHQDLTQWGGIPVLVLDVWEHAYYLDYQNRRSDYVHAWWQLTNWPEVERRLRLTMRAQMPISLEQAIASWPYC